MELQFQGEMMSDKVTWLSIEYDKTHEDRSLVVSGAFSEKFVEWVLNRSKPKISSFEIMWQRISNGQPKPNGFLDAIVVDTAKMSATIMYNALVNEISQETK
jgi:hypothetical protein